MDGRYDKYVKTNDRGHRFHLVTMVEDRGKCSPISVKMHNGNCVRYRSTAELMPEVESTFDTFWDVLKEGGGEWMWEFVEEKYKEDDMDWLREGMINGTLVWCSDGSYKRKVAPEVSGVGWVVECTKCGKRMEGSFYEESDSANSYRAEQLGVCAVHQLMFALSLFYSISNWETKSGCDNYGAIKISRRRLTRIKPSMKCADVLRNIRTARKKMTTRPDYYHVFGHMDDWLSEDQLSFEQRLNKRCDELAKAAVDCLDSSKTCEDSAKTQTAASF